LPHIDYPLHDKTIVVTRCGRICLGKKKINFSPSLAVRPSASKVHDDIWLVSFMDYDLGYLDLETRLHEPLENPFGPKVLPMSKARCVTHVSGLDPRKVWRARGYSNSRPSA
jgi:putative transposase